MAVMKMRTYQRLVTVIRDGQSFTDNCNEPFEVLSGCFAVHHCFKASIILAYPAARARCAMRAETSLLASACSRARTSLRTRVIRSLELDTFMLPSSGSAPASLSRRHAVSESRRCTDPAQAVNPLPTSFMLPFHMVNITGIVDEVARLKALRALDMLDTPPEAEFDAIAAGARHLFDCKFAFVSLIDADRQWFKAACGLEASETPRDVSFCTHTVAADDLLVITDARQDIRFATNPMVVETPFVRFYAGVPLRVTPPGGGAALPIGTLCVADDNPQDPTPDKLEILIGMARVAEALLEARRTSKENLQLALDRQEALDDMARTHRLLQHAERMARIGSWRLELESGQLHWSDQTYTIHGLAPGSQEQLGTAMQFYPEDDRAKLEAALDRCAQLGTAWDLELNFTDAQGRPRRVRRWVRSMSAPVSASPLWE
jgi:hypothetical protein